MRKMIKIGKWYINTDFVTHIEYQESNPLYPAEIGIHTLGSYTRIEESWLEPYGLTLLEAIDLIEKDLNRKVDKNGN